MRLASYLVYMYNLEIMHWTEKFSAPLGPIVRARNIHSLMRPVMLLMAGITYSMFLPRH